MFIVIICSFLAVFLSYLDSRQIFNNGMKLGFIMVTFLAVIHYDYGNDYMAYYSLYKEIITYPSLISVLDKDVYRDIGWPFVNYIFQYLGGFFVLVAALSIFEGVVYYKTIKKYVPRELWWLGTVIYLMVPSFYLYNFSMLRQGFVIAVFLSLWPLIEKRKWWIAASLLYLSSFIHGSALILILFSFWGFLPVKNSKSFVLLYTGVLIAFYLSSTLVSDISDFVFEKTDAFDGYLETYSQGKKGTSIGLGLGFIMYLIPLIVQLVFIGNSSVKESSKRLVALSCLSSFFIPLSFVIPAVGRVSMYFSAYNTVAIPLAYNEIIDRLTRNVLIVMYIVILLYDYYIFFTSEVWKVAYTTFNTIFSLL